MSKRNRPTPEPQRTCIGCRRRRSQRELTRFVLDDEGDLQIGRYRAGRGAWLCADRLISCFDRATTAGRWNRALRARVPTSAVTSLRNRLDPHRSSSASR